MTYNQTINKLILLFGTITDRRQIPMAAKYADMLVTKFRRRADGESDNYWEKWEKQDELRNLVSSNVERLYSEFEKV